MGIVSPPNEDDITDNMVKIMKKQQDMSVDSALRALLIQGNVGTHEDICRALEKQGYTINQPKVSRLLHKIGAIKVINENGENIYRLPHEHGLTHELNRSSTRKPANQWVIDIVSNTTLIVIHTTPGAAALVAREIDLHHLKLGILGSIAGDDTIFIAPKNITHIESVIDGIKKALLI